MPHRALCGPIVAHFGTLCFAFSGFEDAASAPSLRTNYLPLGLESCWGFPVSHACRTEPFADRLWHILARFALLLAVSKMQFWQPLHGGAVHRADSVSMWRVRHFTTHSVFGHVFLLGGLCLLCIALFFFASLLFFSHALDSVGIWGRRHGR